jgi:hypothetical protein
MAKQCNFTWISKWSSKPKWLSRIGLDMGWAFITDIQMPRTFWYWALHQSVKVLNYITCTEEGISTTLHELVYGIKSDLQV